MGFSVRLAPGVRVRMSSRGVRTSLGPRIARVHVGAGRPGISTGVGPFGYYTSLGGSSGSRSSGGSRGGGSSYAGSYGITPAQHSKLLAANEITARLNELTNAHKVVFPVPAPATATVAEVESIEVLEKRIRKQLLTGVSIFAVSERKARKAQAKVDALAEQTRLQQQALTEARVRQAELDLYWSQLNANDPSVVIEEITRAFGDNEAKAAVLSVTGDSATILMMAPGTDILPGKKVGVTDSGNVSIRQMSSKESRVLYAEMISSHALATASEAFASAPGLKTVRLVISRRDPLGRNEFIGAGTLSRERTRTVIAEAESAYSGLQLAGDEPWLANIDNALVIRALDLRSEPELAALLSEISRTDVDAEPGAGAVAGADLVAGVEPGSGAEPVAIAPPANRPTFCRQCGTRFADSDNFCGECGGARV